LWLLDDNDLIYTRLEAFFHPLIFCWPSMWVIKDIQLYLSSCQCLSLHKTDEKLVKKWITKYANLVYFGKLLLLTLNLKFLHKNHIFWVWDQLTKWRSFSLVSSPIWILKNFIILNILLQFELWMYFQCLFNSNYRMTWKFNLHHSVHHCNIYIWLIFSIWYDFLHFFFKNSKKHFYKKILKICEVKKTWNQWSWVHPLKVKSLGTLNLQSMKIFTLKFWKNALEQVK